MGVQLQHVPYKGDSAVIVDLVSGQIPMALLGVGNAMQFAKDPRLSFIGVIWPSRLPVMPNVAGRRCVHETGMRDGPRMEPILVGTDDKVRFIDALSQAGPRKIEVISST